MKKGREEHNKYQQHLFTRKVKDFSVPISPEVQQRLQRIVATAQLMKGERVLDGGTGIGVLIRYFRSYGIEYIVGCDLSSVMLAEAQRRHPDVIIWCGDIIDLPANLRPFDAIFLNAMFGNVWNQQETLSKVSEFLTKVGRISISHPLGSRYVAELNRTDPRRTPHTLPARDRLMKMVRPLPLELIRHEDDPDFYLAVLKKV